MTDSVTIRLVYAGRRDSGKAKPYHEWHHVAEPDNNALVFDKLVGTAIGGIYEVAAWDLSGGRIFPSTKRYTGDRLEGWDDLVDAWRAMDIAYNERSQRDKAERALAKQNGLDHYITPLENIAALCRTRHDATVLGEYVKQRIIESYWKGK